MTCSSRDLGSWPGFYYSYGLLTLLFESCKEEPLCLVFYFDNSSLFSHNNTFSHDLLIMSKGLFILLDSVTVVPIVLHSPAPSLCSNVFLKRFMKIMY